MIWINIRTVATEIYLTVSDIPQMSGSVFFPHKLETVFGKIYLTGQAVNAPPAGFIWQQICYSIRCCRRQLSFVKSIPAGYTIYRCVIDTMHTFIRFSIYKIIFVRFMEVLTFSFQHTGKSEIYLPVFHIPGSCTILTHTGIGKINLATFPDVPPGTIVLHQLMICPGHHAVLKIIPALSAIDRHIAKSVHTGIHLTICHIVPVRPVVLSLTDHTGMIKLYFPFRNIPGSCFVGTQTGVGIVHTVPAHIQPLIPNRLQCTVCFVRHFSMFHIVPVTVVELLHSM